MEFENNAYFWQKLDTLFLSSELIINRPKNSIHPQYSNLIYPVDYGYLNANNTEGEELIDVFKGTGDEFGVQAIIICADILKKDVDVKLLVSCTEEEIQAILLFLNQTDFQKTIICRRGDNIPRWTITN